MITQFENVEEPFEIATVEKIVNKIAEIKSRDISPVSNIFLDYRSIEKLVSTKQCLLLFKQDVFLVLVPYHDCFYDVLFMAKDKDSLSEMISSFKNTYGLDFFVRVLVIGKEAQVNALSNIFVKEGFVLAKRLARTKIDIAVQSEATEAVKSLKERGTKIKVKKRPMISFAKLGDEKEILCLLKDEFNVCDDNIPELIDIMENIEKQQVIVARDRGKIVAVHYFLTDKGKCYGMYDVTKKEYRHDFLAFDIGEFKANNMAHNHCINRYGGWRDIDNRRLMRFAILNNEFPDGIYIYTLRWSK